MNHFLFGNIFMSKASNSLKLLKIKHILFFAIILLIQPQWVSAQDNDRKIVQISDQNQKEIMINIAAEVVRSSKDLSQIWPGYWPEDQAFILKISDKGALLIAPSHGLNSFKPISDNQLPDELHGKSYFHEGNLDGAVQPFILNYDIGDDRTTILVNAGGFSRVNIISLLLHEQFHAYQDQAYIDDSKFPSINPSDIKDRVGFATLAEIERRILIDALSEKNAAKRLEILHHYFIIRQYRENIVPQIAVDTEQYLERLEGVAEYVSKVGESIIYKSGEQGLRQSLIKSLKSDLLEIGSSYTTALFRNRSYQTGAALTYLLDFHNDGDWKKKIENGSFVDELLEGSIDISTHITIDAIYKKYGYDEIYNEFETIISKINEAEINSVDSFINSKSHRLVIDSRLAHNNRVSGFTATNMSPLEGGAIALGTAKLYNKIADGFSLTVKEQPMLLQGNIITIILSNLPQISDTQIYETGEYHLDNIHIADNGIELKIDIPLILTIADNVMTIKILETDKKSDEKI